MYGLALGSLTTSLSTQYRSVHR